MEYRQNDWSILGFGCMRFPKKGGSVDMKETERELAYAIAHGVNYFDTAYIYRGNEKVLGELVAKNHWRAQIQIATKMPHYLIHSIDELEKLFCEQLKRLQTDYVDNYLMHMLPDVHIWEKLVRMGILDWIREKKEKGEGVSCQRREKEGKKTERERKRKERRKKGGGEKRRRGKSSRHSI